MSCSLVLPFGRLHLVGIVSYIKTHLFHNIFLLMVSLIPSKFTNSKINHWKLRHCSPSWHRLILVAVNLLTFNGNVSQQNRWRKQNKRTPFGSIKSVQCKQKDQKSSQGVGRWRLKSASEVDILFLAFPYLWWTKPSSLAIKRGRNPGPTEIMPELLATLMASKSDPAPFVQKNPRVLHCHYFHTHASTFEMHRGISQETLAA